MKIKTMKELRRYAKEIYTDQDGIWVILKDNYVVTDDNQRQQGEHSV